MLCTKRAFYTPLARAIISIARAIINFAVVQDRTGRYTVYYYFFCGI